MLVLRFVVLSQHIRDRSSCSITFDVTQCNTWCHMTNHVASHDKSRDVTWQITWRHMTYHITSYETATRRSRLRVAASSRSDPCHVVYNRWTPPAVSVANLLGLTRRSSLRNLLSKTSVSLFVFLNVFFLHLIKFLSTLPTLNFS